jgi:hypothetical protein
MAYSKTTPVDGDEGRDLLSAINAEEESAYGSDGDSVLNDECATNIDRYLGRNNNPAPEGRSQVRDRSVYETVQWVMPSLSRIFCGDQVVDLPPVGPEDIESAKQETEYLNHVVMVKNNWFEIFDTGAKDALLTKRGYLYPYKEIIKVPEVECYEKQTPESLAILMQDNPEVVSQEEYPDPDYKPQPQMVQDPLTGQPQMVIPPPPMLYDIKIRRVKEEVKYCIEALPPERCKVSEKTKTVQVADTCPYFEYYDFPTISELRQQGFDIDDDIGTTDDDITPEDTARNQFSELGTDDTNAIDLSMRRVRCRWVWIRYDFDKDGIAELQYCVIVGKEILHREECNRIPIAVLCPDKLPHRHIGMCPADTVGELEEIKTVILRGGLDNLYQTQNTQKFGDPTKVNLDDLMVSRPGSIIRLKPGAVFGQNFGTMPQEFFFPQAMEGLEYMDQIKENRAGVNRYFTGIDQNALNKTKGGMEMLSSMSAQRVEQIARHLANGIEVLASLMHEIILKSGHQKQVVQLRGKFVTVDPSTWRKRTDFRISVGYAAGNKDMMLQRLMLLANLQKEAKMGGSPIVNDRNLYETAIEITKATDMQGPDRFWQDPSQAPPPQPPQPDPSVVFAEQENTKRTIHAKQLDVEQKERDSQRDFAIKQYEIETNVRSTLEAERLRIDSAHQLEDRKTVNQAGIKQLEGQQQLQLSEHAAQLEQQPAQEMAEEVKKLSGALAEAIESMKGALQVILTAKRQIRRGKNGKAEGVDIVGPDGSVIAQQSVVRGDDGRIAGAQ